MKIRYIVSVVALVVSPAQAETVYRLTAPTVACAAPAATRDANEAMQHGRDLTKFEKLYDCHVINDAGQWDEIAENGDMLLLRKTPPTPGLPPLYFVRRAVTPGGDISSSEKDLIQTVESFRVDHHGSNQKLSASRAAHKEQSDASVPSLVSALPEKDIFKNTVQAFREKMHTLSERMGWQNGLVKFVEWGVGLYVLLKIGGAYRRRRAFRKALQTGKRLIDSLADRLQIRRKQLVFQNAYGTTIYDKWNKEKSDFMKREVYACFAKAGYEKYFEKATPLLLTYLDQVAFTEPRAVPVKSSNPDIYSPDMDPFDYERYCAKLLRKSGWEAIVTSECGDQGADIVASKKGLRLVLQCKLYSKAVGNDAVQQVAAAKHHYAGRFAAVVSNAPYTIPAQQLAKTNKIFLLHHDELQSFVRRLENFASARVRG
ncbi:restriction endonuclease [Acetobacter tropicalis]|uniref:restriction endonuclease n=1 Tax=Acetobacter tropicalis TaxID=104102 RepID=UPI0007772E7F|nr:restriction endonuclease [Acetobacter tropicalis]